MNIVNISPFKRHIRMKHGLVFKLDFQQYNCENRMKFHSVVFCVMREHNIQTEKQTHKNYKYNVFEFYWPYEATSYIFPQIASMYRHKQATVLLYMEILF